jgi:hypothetical protein
VFAVGLLTPVVALSDSGPGDCPGPDYCPTGTTATTTVTTTTTVTVTTTVTSTATVTTTTTSPAPPPATVTATTPSTTPAAGSTTQSGPNGIVAGKTALAKVISGTIYFRVPHTIAIVKLKGAKLIPINSDLDTRGGVVAVTAAGSAGTQTADISTGVFKLKQDLPTFGSAREGNKKTKASGKAGSSGPIVTELHLIGGDFGACTSSSIQSAPAPTGSSGPTTGIQGSIAKAKPKKRKKVVRSLWAKESGGSWKTVGGDASATVLGTWWLTEDTCTGTTISVKQGAVSVTNLRTHRVVGLKAGQSYTAEGSLAD